MNRDERRLLKVEIVEENIDLFPLGDIIPTEVKNHRNYLDLFKPHPSKGVDSVINTLNNVWKREVFR